MALIGGRVEQAGDDARVPAIYLNFPKNRSIDKRTENIGIDRGA